MIKFNWSKEELNILLQKIKELNIDISYFNIEEDTSNSALLNIGTDNIDNAIPVLLEILNTNKYLFLKTEDGYKKFILKNIFFIESFSNYSIVKDNSKFGVIVYESLINLEKILSNYSFIRISKTHLVNVIHIDSIKASLNSKLVLVLDNGSNISVTRSYVKGFKQKLLS